MITLASTNNQNVTVCSSTTNEDTSNPDMNTGLTTDSKLHSQVSSDTYVLNKIYQNEE